MRYATLAIRGTAFGLVLAGLAGCFTFAGSPNLPVRPRPPIRFEPAPDLRIPRTALVAAPEIPLVPLPIPPSDRPADKKPAKPDAPVNPVRTEAPASPPKATPAAVPPMPDPPPSGASKNQTTTGTAPLLGSPLRRAYQQAVARYAEMDSFIVRLTRREMIRGKQEPEEVILFKFRKAPWSLHFKWLDGEGLGREVIYVKDRMENKIHTLLAAGDIPLMPAGKRISLPVDSILVKTASRHAITEAGIGANMERIGLLLNALERGDRKFGALNDLGPQARPEFPLPAHAFEQVLPPGLETDLPNGGRRTYWFDPDTKLPLLVQARDDKGKEVEYYFYTRLLSPVNLDDHDFNPDKLWGTTPPAK